jgi:mannitol/fructose-specific phosphotransferase system IIA component (Ntr-type)
VAAVAEAVTPMLLHQVQVDRVAADLAAAEREQMNSAAVAAAVMVPHHQVQVALEETVWFLFED